MNPNPLILSKSATEHRLFLGIALPGEMRRDLEAFAALHAGLPGIRWTASQNQHITTVFLGNVATEMVPNLVALLHIALRGIPPFELRFARFRLAPKASDPRMIWAQFEKDDTWLRAVRQINELLDQVLPTRQSRHSPIPHITLARLRDFRDADQLRLARPLAPETLAVQELILWESILLPTGPRYEEVARFSLPSNFKEKSG